MHSAMLKRIILGNQYRVILGGGADYFNCEACLATNALVLFCEDNYTKYQLFHLNKN